MGRTILLWDIFIMRLKIISLRILFVAQVTAFLSCTGGCGLLEQSSTNTLRNQAGREVPVRWSGWTKGKRDDPSALLDFDSLYQSTASDKISRWLRFWPDGGMCVFYRTFTPTAQHDVLSAEDGENLMMAVYGRYALDGRTLSIEMLIKAEGKGSALWRIEAEIDDKGNLINVGPPFFSPVADASWGPFQRIPVGPMKGTPDW